MQKLMQWLAMLASVAALVALVFMYKNDGDFGGHLEKMDAIQRDVATIKMEQATLMPTLARVAIAAEISAQKNARLVELYEAYITLAVSAEPQDRKRLDEIAKAIKRLRDEMRGKGASPVTPGPLTKLPSYRPAKTWDFDHGKPIFLD